MQAAPFRFLSRGVGAAVFLFFALMLAVPRGYAVGAVLLLLCSVYCLAQRPAVGLSRESRRLIALLLAVFVTHAFSLMYHGNSSRELDSASRYLLAVPVFLLFLVVRVNIQWLWSGVIVGCLLTAAWTYWETGLRNASKAFGHTGAIQFGNMSLMMGVFCAVGFFWALKRQSNMRPLWLIAFGVATACGLYGSIASGTRGGWIALPLIAVLFCTAFVRRQNLKWAVAAFAGLMVAAVAIVATVPTITARYDEAKKDIHLYLQGDKRGSIGARFAIWETAVDLIGQKPVLGWGKAEYRAELERMAQNQTADPVVLKLANIHNNYLEIWVFQGVFGLLAVVGLFIVGFVYAARHLRSSNPDRQAMALCAACLIAGYAIFNLSQNMLERNNTLLFFCVSFVLFQASILGKFPSDVDGQPA